MSQALSRKWRPARFTDVVGQEHVTQTLQNALLGDRVSHAYLFCGPRGTGKTTTARLLAKAVNCLDDDVASRPCNACRVCQAVNEGRFLDLIEIDAASNTGVDDIRDLRDKINFAPSEGRFKVYIIDEVHMLSTAAFNALLKTLEEPPAHVIFVLATTEEHKVPVTIKSRCQQFNFRLLSVPEIIGRLQFIAAEESLAIDAEAVNLIAREGAGSIRDAESLLDQLVTAPGATITLERAQQVLGTASTQAVQELTDAWLANDAARGLGVIHAGLRAGADARQFCRQMVTHLRYMLLVKTGGDTLPLPVSADQLATIQAQAAQARHKRLIDAIRLFNTASTQPSSNWQPQLPLELAFVESLDQLWPDEPPLSATRTVSAEAQPPQTRPATPQPIQPDPQPSAPVSAEPEPQAAPTPSETPVAEPVVDPPVEETAPAAGVPLDVVQSQWPTVMQTVRQRDRNLGALLAQCKPLAVEQDTVVLGFDFPILKEKFSAEQRAIHLVAEALSTTLKQSCRVKAVITGSYTVPETITKEAFTALASELGGVVSES